MRNITSLRPSVQSGPRTLSADVIAPSRPGKALAPLTQALWDFLRDSAQADLYIPIAEDRTEDLEFPRIHSAISTLKRLAASISDAPERSSVLEKDMLIPKVSIGLHTYWEGRKRVVDHGMIIVSKQSKASQLVSEEPEAKVPAAKPKRSG